MAAIADPGVLLALTAVISAVARLVWAFRRSAARAPGRKRGS
jgi:hypothetical protein